MLELANGRPHLAEEVEVVDWMDAEVAAEHTQGAATCDEEAVEAAVHGMRIASEEHDDAIRCGQRTGGSDLHHRCPSLV